MVSPRVVGVVSIQIEQSTLMASQWNEKEHQQYANMYHQCDLKSFASLELQTPSSLKRYQRLTSRVLL